MVPRYARTAHSAHSLRSAPLASLARSIHGLAHSLRSLPQGTVEIHKSVFTLKSRFTRTIEILVVTRNTPTFYQPIELVSKQLTTQISDTKAILVISFYLIVMPPFAQYVGQ